MARLKLKNDHNKFAILKKVKGQELFDSMVEFLQRSKIHYALTHSPDVIYESLVKQELKTKHGVTIQTYLQ
jgi:hypothetical protein